MYTAVLFLVSLTIILGLVFLPRYGLAPMTRRWLKLRRRVLIEDELKVLVSSAHNHLAVAASVHIQTADERVDLQGVSIPLSELGIGDEGEIVSLSEKCRGLTRRRLMDLGLTPRTRIKAHLANALSSARGYQVRGTLIALRKEQADQIFIKSAGIESTEKKVTC